MLYTRPQLRLLLVLATTLLVGFAVREWRAGFPAHAERLERFDREEPPLLPVESMQKPVAESRGRRERPGGAAGPGGSGHAGGAAVEARVAQAGKADPRPLDLNRASVEQIARLPGVGPSLARRILQERERQGRFDSPEGLRNVYGLGPRKLAAIRDHVTVSE